MAQESVSPLKGLFDAQTQAEVTKHAADAPRAGFENLPPGIRGGVAKLHSIEFNQYGPDTKKSKLDGSKAVGEWYCQLTGVVQWPFEHVLQDGSVVKIWGKQTRIQIAMMDQKWGANVRTKKEAIQEVMDHMKRLSNNQFIFCDANRQPRLITPELLVQTANALVAANKYFHFTTSAGKKEGSSFDNWGTSDGLEKYVPKKPGAAAVRDANEAPPAQQQPAPAPQTQVAVLPPTQPPAAAAAVPGGDDPDALVRLAGGDASLPETAPAQHRLAEMAKANGWTDKEIEDAADWPALGGMARKSKQAASPHANDTPAGPKKGDVWGYVKAPYNDKGTWRNALVHLVEANPDGTFELLNWDDKKTTYSRVPASDLAPA